MFDFFTLLKRFQLSGHRWLQENMFFRNTILSEGARALPGAVGRCTLASPLIDRQRQKRSRFSRTRLLSFALVGK